MAFLTWYRLYKLVVMPIGLINAPERFMQTLNNLFMDMLDKAVVVFLDDVLIFSIVAEEHFESLKKVFKCLHKYNSYCKLKKCSFL